MSEIGVRDVYTALGTYGIGDQVVYRDGTELAAVVNIDLKNERNELKKGGSGRTYDLSSTVGVTIELESWAVYRENYVKFLGYQNRPTTDTQNHEVPGYAVTGKDVAPELGFMFMVDNHQEAARAAFNLPYTLERKWSVIHVFKATIHEEGLNASTHISGESPSYEDTKLIIKGEMLNTEGQDIYTRHWFASEEEARLYILKTMRVQMNVQFEVNPDAENEENRIVNIPLIGGIRYGLEELMNYLRGHVMENQVVRELLIQGVEGAVNYVIPGSSLFLGRIIRPIFNAENDPQGEGNDS